MSRRPPGSKRTETLFPYTTLVRSGAVAGVGFDFGAEVLHVVQREPHRPLWIQPLPGHAEDGVDEVEIGDVGAVGIAQVAAEVAGVGAGQAAEVVVVVGGVGDRKSTRLNSSH